MNKAKKLFSMAGLLALLCYGTTLAGYFLNKKVLTLPFEIVYFAGIVLTLLYLGYQLFILGRKKEFRENTHWAVSAVMFLAILVVLYLIASKHHKLIDVSENKKFSLSDQTLKILGSLNDDVQAYVFLKKGQEGADEVEKMLEQYSYHSKKFHYEMVNPEEKPLLAQEYQIEQFGEMVLKTASKSEKVKTPLEEQVTNGLLKVTSDRVKKVVFLAGHNEPSLEDGEKNGYSLIKKQLELQNYQVSELWLVREPAIPDDTDCFIVASPKSDLQESEIAALRQYVEKGGSVLFLLDPEIVPSLETLVGELGFEMKKAVLVDPLSRVFGGSVLTPVLATYIPHPITENFRVACFLPLARMTDVKSPLPNGFTGYGIAFTGPGSWAETNLESLKEKPEFTQGEDIQGPVSLVAVMEKNMQTPEEEETGKNQQPKKQTRLVAFGDSNFIDNSSIGLSGNKDLFLNSVAWLSGDENKIAIRKTQTESVPLFLNGIQQAFLFFVPVIGMPFLVLLFGIIKMIRLKKEIL